jgi:hypothetical protein
LQEEDRLEKDGWTKIGLDLEELGFSSMFLWVKSVVRNTAVQIESSELILQELKNCRMLLKATPSDDGLRRREAKLVRQLEQAMEAEDKKKAQLDNPFQVCVCVPGGARVRPESPHPPPWRL